MAVITFVKVFYFRVPKERDIAVPRYLSSKFLWEWDLKPQEGPVCVQRGSRDGERNCRDNSQQA
jgi:hypothetical protein